MSWEMWGDLGVKLPCQLREGAASAVLGESEG